MNILPGLQRIVDDLNERFSTRIEAIRPARPNEVYFDAPMELVPGFCAQVYRKWNGRLVSLFADDARADAGVFHLYYVFALDEAHGFLILRVPVNPREPQFASLTNALPAANWQEREVQDLFGLKLEGHPNPRRCALHDVGRRMNARLAAVAFDGDLDERNARLIEEFYAAFDAHDAERPHEALERIGQLEPEVRVEGSCGVVERRRAVKAEALGTHT